MSNQVDAHNTNLSEADARRLLDTLCERNGFCLAPLWRERLTRFPPRSIDAFTDTVFRAEGLDPAAAGKAVYAAVRSEVRSAFERSASVAHAGRKPG